MEASAVAEVTAEAEEVSAAAVTAVAAAALEAVHAEAASEEVLAEAVCLAAADREEDPEVPRREVRAEIAAGAGDGDVPTTAALAG